MKHLLSLFIFVGVSISLFAQNLTLSEVLSVREKSLAEAEEYLAQRSWSFYKIYDESGESLDCMAFSYNQNSYDDYADSFIMLYYSSDASQPKRIAIQTDEKKYNEYLNQIKAWGGKLINSYTENGCFYKVYQGSTITYLIKLSNQTGGKDANNSDYKFTIMINSDYVAN